MVGPVVVFLLGCALIVSAILSAIRTFVVPRGSAPDVLTRGAFVVMRYVFDPPLRHTRAPPTSGASEPWHTTRRSLCSPSPSCGWRVCCSAMQPFTGPWAPRPGAQLL